MFEISEFESQDMKRLFKRVGKVADGRQVSSRIRFMLRFVEYILIPDHFPLYGCMYLILYHSTNRSTRYHTVPKLTLCHISSCYVYA